MSYCTIPLYSIGTVTVAVALIVVVAELYGIFTGTSTGSGTGAGTGATAFAVTAAVAGTVTATVLFCTVLLGDPMHAQTRQPACQEGPSAAPFSCCRPSHCSTTCHMLVH